MVQEGALTAMASVADCAKAAFERYYDTVMPLLRTALSTKGGDKQQVLFTCGPSYCCLGPLTRRNTQVTLKKVRISEQWCIDCPTAGGDDNIPSSSRA